MRSMRQKRKHSPAAIQLRTVMGWPSGRIHPPLSMRAMGAGLGRRTADGAPGMSASAHGSGSGRIRAGSVRNRLRQAAVIGS